MVYGSRLLGSQVQRAILLAALVVFPEAFLSLVKTVRTLAVDLQMTTILESLDIEPPATLVT